MGPDGRIGEPSIPPERPSVVAVIPTANRARLAISASRSLLSQRDVDVHVVVSDNSTRPEESELLERSCRETADPRLTYLRPDVHLPMATHWDWAIGRALERTPASHLMVHYDRKVTKPGALHRLLEAAARVPGRVITYSVDQVSDLPEAFTLWQQPWTGRLFAITTARVIELTVDGAIDAMGQVFPILSNCVVPRAVLLTIRERFGTFCESTTPDSCFAYRFSALYDDFVCCDYPAGILHAPQRSNGLGYLRHTGGDFPAFMADWGDRPWLDAAPIPGLTLGQNILFHEYELVRREVGPRLPSLDFERYLESLAGGLHFVQADDVRRRLRGILEAHGLPAGGVSDRPVQEGRPPTPSVSLPRRIFRRMWRELTTRARRSVLVRMWGYVRPLPAQINGLRFVSDERAVAFALRATRHPVRTHETLDTLRAEVIRE